MHGIMICFSSLRYLDDQRHNSMVWIYESQRASLTISMQIVQGAIFEDRLKKVLIRSQHMRLRLCENWPRELKEVLKE
jgi:hypothetical protein